jgi:hypothetical protein
VGRQHQRDALLLEPEQPVPEDVPGLGVESGGRLVEEQQVRVVDQRPGDRQPPLQAAGEAVDLLAALVGELEERQELVGPGGHLGARQSEVAPVDQQVLAHRELGVERVVLRAHPQPRPDRGPVLGGVEAEHPQLAAARR